MNYFMSGVFLRKMLIKLNIYRGEGNQNIKSTIEITIYNQF